jgi:cobalamin biosynthetic protein CobC
MRDHGGNLDEAMARHGAGDWIDLSTGINRRPWPVPAIPPEAWTALPTRSAQDGLIAAARAAWRVAPGTAGTALAGAQAAIQLVPGLRAPGSARVLGPTYNEHAAALRSQGWQVAEVPDPAALEGADLAVLVNPNNPDGRTLAPEALRVLAAQVGLLVVDESFADALPALSLLPQDLPANVIVLRSFGKFYGLAGLRLGFVFAAAPVIVRLAERAGPWPVSGPAIHVGRAALSDGPWAAAMRMRLAGDAARADALAKAAGWDVAGGTPLFRLYRTPDAAAARDGLARHRIWSRIFPWSPHLLRLGLPGPEVEWDRLSAALSDREMGR